jgi:hypothetical protein
MIFLILRNIYIFVILVLFYLKKKLITIWWELPNDNQLFSNLWDRQHENWEMFLYKNIDDSNLVYKFF